MLVQTAVNERDSLLSRIAALEAENARLREALEPIVKVEFETHLDDASSIAVGVPITAGDLRHARSVLNEG